MKREHFLKTIAGLASGLTVVSCSNDLISDLVDTQQPQDDLSINEAQKWFNEEYLPKITSTIRKSANGKNHKRNADWNKAQKPQNNEKKSFVWIPINYEDDARPAVLLYDNQTLFKKELAKYYLQPVLEGLIVVNDGKEKKAFLAQIAYDPFLLAANNYILEKSNFTGTLLKADWDDNLIDGTIYEKGKIIKGFKSTVNVDNARTQGCDVNWVSSSYSWYVGSDGFVTVEHKNWQVTCDGSGSGGFGYGYGTGGGGSSGGSGSSEGGGGVYDPLINSGAGGMSYNTTKLYDFNITNAIKSDGTDRLNMNVNIARVQQAIGLTSDLTTWSLDKADALSRSVGANLSKSFPLIYNTTKAIGVLQAVSGAYDVWFIVKDGDCKLNCVTS